jgi:hypothetical protein
VDADNYKKKQNTANDNKLLQKYGDKSKINGKVYTLFKFKGS